MERLTKICLVVSILGIIFLSLISNFFIPDLISISQINPDLLNQKVRVSGEIINLRTYDDFQILTLEDHSGKIDVTCNCNLSKDQDIEVLGKVSEYKENIQIEAEKIKKL
jgi:RecJ-like exonuclease